MIKSGRLIIKYVPRRIIRDYDGMNYYAAKKLGYPFIKSKNEVHIAQDLSADDKRKTLRHEINESNLISRKGYKYWRAHVLADRKDKYIKRVLKKHLRR